MPDQSFSPSPRPTAVTKERSTYAHVMDVTRFLSTYLSGKQNVWVMPHGTSGFACQYPYTVAGKPYFRILVPDWRKYSLPNLDEFGKYRIFRFGTGHESGHAKHSPQEVFSHGIIPDPSAAKSGLTHDRLAHDVINVIEDRRIEDLLTEEFPGYVPERIFSNSYAYGVRPSPLEYYEQARKWRDDTTSSDPYVATRAENAEKRARYEAFMQGLIVGKIKDLDKLPPQDRQHIEVAVRMVEAELEVLKGKDPETIYTALVKLTNRVIKDLDLRGRTPPEPPPQSGDQGKQGDGEDDKGEGNGKRDIEKEAQDPIGKGTDFGSADSEWDETFKESEANRADPQDLERDKEEYLQEQETRAKDLAKGEEKKKPGEVTNDDVQQARQGSRQAQDEFQRAQQPEAEFDPALAVWSPVAAALPPEPFRDNSFISKMREHLRDWRVGRKDVVGESGEYFSVPGYVTTRDARSPKPFIHRIRMSAKGRKVMFLLDFSSSMSGREPEYKRAVISTLETLGDIGVKTGVFAFAGETQPSGYSNNGFFKVKSFEEPKWTRFHSGKLAALEADYGSTPTGSAYQAIENYLNRHRPDVFVTITDGQPNSNEHELVKEKVREFKRKTRMVAFGIGPPESMTENLREFGYHKVFAASDVQEIPKKLVPMMAPEAAYR